MAKKEKKEKKDPIVSGGRRCFDIFGGIYTELPPEKEEKKKGTDVFKFIDIIFDGVTDINKRFTRYELSKYYFMLNRFMSIQLPEGADKMNLNGIDEASVVFFWTKYLRHTYNTKPGFFYTKTKKEVLEWTPTEDLKREYRKIHEMDNKTFKDAMRVYPKETMTQLKELENLLENYSK